MHYLRDIILGQSFQQIHPRTGQQGVIQLKGGVFRGGANKDDRAILDMRQKGILLAFIETVHLIDKQQGTPSAITVVFGAIDRRPDLFHSGGNSGNPFYVRLTVAGHQFGQCGFARTGRPPQDHGVTMPGFYRPSQRFTFSQQMTLANILF